MAVGYFYRVDVRGRYQGQLIVNTYNYRTTVAPLAVREVNDLSIVNWSDEQELSALMTAFKDSFEPTYTTISVDSCVYNTVRVSRVTSVSANRYSLSNSVDWHSGRAAVGCPSGVTAVMTRKFATTGSRRFRGRLSLAGIDLADTEAGVVRSAGATWTRMGALAVRLISTIDYVAGGVEYRCQWIPVIGNFRRPTAGDNFLWRPVDLATRRAPLGTQRSRLPGHGRSG